MDQPEQSKRIIAIVLFDGLTLLDAIGPYEVLARLPNTRVEFVGRGLDPVFDSANQARLLPSATFDDLPNPDVVLVPGGDRVHEACHDQELLRWLSAAHAGATVTASVCTGALLLGAASILDGRRATTHWLAREQLASLGAVPVDDRVVVDGDIITSAGVSAGIDMALQLASRLSDERTAQAIQLSLEYAPDPPFDAGSPTSAPAAVTELVTQLAQRRADRRSAVG